LEHAGVGFLHHVVDVAERGKLGAQPSPQSRVVRLHFSDKLAGVIG
jgi:hypothetical protein